jgi:hypothetical protein
MQENINELPAPPDNLVSKSGLFSGMNAIMAVASMVMILAFVGFTISDVERSSALFTVGKNFIIETTVGVLVCHFVGFRYVGHVHHAIYGR